VLQCFKCRGLVLGCQILTGQVLDECKNERFIRSGGAFDDQDLSPACIVWGFGGELLQRCQPTVSLDQHPPHTLSSDQEGLQQPVLTDGVDELGEGLVSLEYLARVLRIRLDRLDRDWRGGAQDRAGARGEHWSFGQTGKARAASKWFRRRRRHR
jgi:hypothetical protein